MRQPIRVAPPTAPTEDEDPVSIAPEFDEDDVTSGFEPDYSNLFATLNEDGDLDDSTSDDLDVGAHVEDPQEADLALDAEIEVDVGVVIDAFSGFDEAVADNESGPLDFDPSEGLADLGSVADGPDDPDADDEPAFEPDLPELDRSEDEEHDAGIDVAAGWAPFDAEDSPTEPLAEPWTPIELSGEPVTAGCLDPDGVLLGGRALVQVTRAGTREKLTFVPSAIASIASAAGTVCFTTKTGELYCFGDGVAEPISSWRSGTNARSGRPVDLVVSGARSELLLKADGALLSSDDGAQWARVGVPTVLALGAGPDVLVVIGDNETPVIADRDSGWQPRPARGAELLLGPSALVTAMDQVVLVALPGVGAALSVDRGETFERVGGSGTVSAITIGSVLGRTLVFMALHHAALGRSQIVYTNEERILRKVGEVASLAGDDVDDERERVTGLLWDADGGRLIAFGVFGARAWHPPDA